MTDELADYRIPLILTRLMFPDAQRGIRAGLLSSVSTYKEHALHGFMAPEMIKDASLGEIGAGVPADARGRYQLQLATVLPELFPTPGSELDYFVKLATDRHTYVNLAVSNQMARLRYRRNDDDWHALVPLYGLRRQDGTPWPHIPSNHHMEPLKTVVAWTSFIRGDTLESALECSIYERAEAFAQLVNLFLRAQRAAKQLDAANVLTPVLRRDSFPYFYYLVTGADESRPTFGRVVCNLHLAAYRSEGMSDDQRGRFARFASNVAARDPSDEMLRSAFSHARAGDLAYSLLLSVMVAETVTARFVRRRLEERGVSNRSIKQSEKELTYNHMLNFFVPALLPDGVKMDVDVGSQLNRARKLRNDVVHEGRGQLKQVEIDDILSATVRYVEFLNREEAGSL